MSSPSSPSSNIPHRRGARQLLARRVPVRGCHASQLALAALPPDGIAQKETQLVLSRLVGRHFVLVLAALLCEGADPLVDPFVAVDFGSFGAAAGVGLWLRLVAGGQNGQRNAYIVAITAAASRGILLSSVRAATSSPRKPKTHQRSQSLRVARPPIRPNAHRHGQGHEPIVVGLDGRNPLELAGQHVDRNEPGARAIGAHEAVAHRVGRDGDGKGVAGGRCGFRRILDAELGDESV
jgi:hypothetical protein